MMLRAAAIIRFDQRARTIEGDKHIHSELRTSLKALEDVERHGVECASVVKERGVQVRSAVPSKESRDVKLGCCVLRMQMALIGISDSPGG